MDSPPISIMPHVQEVEKRLSELVLRQEAVICTLFGPRPQPPERERGSNLVEPQPCLAVVVDRIHDRVSQMENQLEYLSGRLGVL